MALLERVHKDMIAAQKEGATLRLTTLRGVLAQIKNREIELRSKEPLSDADVVEVFQKEAKKRREAIVLYEKGGRSDLVDQERSELALIEEYLPAQMSEADIVALVDKTYNAGHQDFAGLMKALMPEVKGRADGKLVAEIVKRRTA